MKHIHAYTSDLNLGSSFQTIPQNSNGDEPIVITAFEIKVPSTITVDVAYSVDGSNYTTLWSSLNNTEKRRSGVLWRKIKVTKTSGSTDYVSINYGQGLSLDNTPESATTGDAEANSLTTRIGSFNYAYNGSTWDRVRSGIVAVATTFLGWINVLAGVRYNATPPTLSDGNVVVLQGDANGNLKTREQYQPVNEDNTNGVATINEKLLGGVSTYAPTIFTNFGANLTLNVKSSAGNVYSIHSHNTNAAVRYIQIHNTATTPAGGAVPLASFLIPANSFKDIDHSMLPAGGLYCSNGIAFAISTTMGTYTASATASEHNTFITYK